MPFFIVSILLQVLLVVHIVKTGRDTSWVYIVVLIPFAGSIAYLIVEILPGLFGSRHGRQAQRKVQQVINPNKYIHSAAFDYSVADTVENAVRLADECIEKGMFSEAKSLYTKSLTGIHAHDPHFMYGLAQCEYGLQNFKECKAVLDALMEHNPEYKNAQAHLLYARTGEQLQDVDLVMQEYEALCDYFPGPEAMYRYAAFLKTLGKTEQANAQLGRILQQAKIGGRHYNALYKAWVTRARKEYVAS